MLSGHECEFFFIQRSWGWLLTVLPGFFQPNHLTNDQFEKNLFV